MLMTQNGNGCLVTEMKREEGSMVKWTEGKESSICFSPWAACDNRCCESLLMGYNTQNGLSFNSDCGTFFTLSWPLRSQLFWGCTLGDDGPQKVQALILDLGGILRLVSASLSLCALPSDPLASPFSAPDPFCPLHPPACAWMSLSPHPSVSAWHLPPSSVSCLCNFTWLPESTFRHAFCVSCVTLFSALSGRHEHVSLWVFSALTSAVYW